MILPDGYSVLGTFVLIQFLFYYFSILEMSDCQYCSQLYKP